VQLQKELEELNERRIQALAEMDAQEELENEDEECDLLCQRTSHVTDATSMGDVDEADVEPSGEEQNPGSDFVDSSKGPQEEVAQDPKKAPVKQKAVHSSIH
jgi:hypothetical protein